jgi:hypothetical protein
MGLKEILLPWEQLIKIMQSITIQKAIAVTSIFLNSMLITIIRERHLASSKKKSHKGTQILEWAHQRSVQQILQTTSPRLKAIIIISMELYKVNIFLKLTDLTSIKLVTLPDICQMQLIIILGNRLKERTTKLGFNTLTVALFTMEPLWLSKGITNR